MSLNKVQPAENLERKGRLSGRAPNKAAQARHEVGSGQRARHKAGSGSVHRTHTTTTPVALHKQELEGKSVRDSTCTPGPPQTNRALWPPTPRSVQSKPGGRARRAGTGAQARRGPLWKVTAWPRHRLPRLRRERNATGQPARPPPHPPTQDTT